MTSTTQRHFAALSYPQIQTWYSQRQFKQLLTFVLETITNILRANLAKIPQLKMLAGRVDELAVIELCVHYKVIEYQDFVQIT